MKEKDETGDYMETTFFISKNTSVTSKQLENEVIGHACEILQRDILTVVTDTRKANEIELVLLDGKNETDAFHILFVSPDKVKVCAETPLGLMYGVLEISHKILGVQPFWYFMEIPPIKKPFIEWTGFDLTLPDFATDYRGWFVNDELLLDQWEDNGSNEYVWERIYETLLRLGGNVIIPGTDKNSHRHRESAQAMGLIYTHHHAEPLGAEMFARRYPGLKASYEEHFALFKELWKKALHEQKGTKVIYTLGFRGQGDCPFWAEDLDRQWSAAEKAAVINEIVHLQYHMVKEVDPHAVCSMNIYGEMTELFNLGLLELPDDVIAIWA
ncbi:MAG: glycosyl hydrolase 115 family protein, partial [Enterococcus casseliflavus]|nr:glycosyl hydrolase 115 family protein [Enterococcus casseliflavus]